MGNRAADVEIQVCEDLDGSAGSRLQRSSARHNGQQRRKAYSPSSFLAAQRPGPSTPCSRRIAPFQPRFHGTGFTSSGRRTPCAGRRSRKQLSVAKESLLSKVPVPPENVHPIRTENPDAQQARRNMKRRSGLFFVSRQENSPLRSCALRDGSGRHTASLFPERMHFLSGDAWWWRIGLRSFVPTGSR